MRSSWSPIRISRPRPGWLVTTVRREASLPATSFPCRSASNCGIPSIELTTNNGSHRPIRRNLHDTKGPRAHPVPRHDLRRSVQSRPTRACPRGRRSSREIARSAPEGPRTKSHNWSRRPRRTRAPCRNAGFAWLRSRRGSVVSTGTETEAAVDSELSMVLYGDYELYRWQPNLLRNPGPQPFRTFMISRLDGPSYDIAKGLVDKALAAEQEGLAGNACIDSRGLSGAGPVQPVRSIAPRTGDPDATSHHLARSGGNDERAVRSGQLSADGPVLRLVQSEEVRRCVRLRRRGGRLPHRKLRGGLAALIPTAHNGAPPMLVDGITATLGPVTEPYLHAFPEPTALLRGPLRRAMPRRGLLPHAAAQFLADPSDRRSAVHAICGKTSEQIKHQT